MTQPAKRSLPTSRSSSSSTSKVVPISSWTMTNGLTSAGRFSFYTRRRRVQSTASSATPLSTATTISLPPSKTSPAHALASSLSSRRTNAMATGPVSMTPLSRIISHLRLRSKSQSRTPASPFLICATCATCTAWKHPARSINSRWSLSLRVPSHSKTSAKLPRCRSDSSADALKWRSSKAF